METFSALLALCAGNSPVTGEFPSQRPVTQSFDVFFDLRLNKRLNKQSWVWWFETPLCSFWRHWIAGNAYIYVCMCVRFLIYRSTYGCERVQYTQWISYLVRCYDQCPFLSLVRSKLMWCSANHRVGYFNNLACIWRSLGRARDRKRAQVRDICYHTHSDAFSYHTSHKQRVLTPGYQGWNDLHSLCRIGMEYHILNM